MKVLFKNTTEEHTLGHLKELHIRSYVLVGLAKILIENGHEDMIQLGADPDAEKGVQRKQAFTRYCERVKDLYPPEILGDPDDPKSNGGMLKEMAALAREKGTKEPAPAHLGTELAREKRTQAAAPATEKNAFGDKNAVGPDTYRRTIWRICFNQSGQG